MNRLGQPKTLLYGEWEVPVIERTWKVSPRVPYRKTYSLKPGQHWKDAPVTEAQWEHYVLLDDGTVAPVGAVIARELLAEGATSAVFTEMWGGVVLVNADLVCVEAEGPIGEVLDQLRAANGGRLAGLPDVLACFPDGRIAMREAKNISAKDRLGPKQHDFARIAQQLFGSKLDLAIVEWGRVPAEATSDMKSAFSPVLDLLYNLEEQRVSGIRGVLNLLPVGPETVISDVLTAREQKLGPKRIDAILEQTAGVLNSHKVIHSIADWPFKHFWGNPYEPRHSKLLGYFLNPAADHKCGSFLLRELLNVLRESGNLPGDTEFSVDSRCEVSVESSRLDILIRRNCEPGKYAIIIENKVNGAVDQPQQLERYVKAVHKLGFEPKQIHVLYLPLTTAKEPNKEDLAAALNFGVNYGHITFETHILGWLHAVVAEEKQPNWPPSMQNGMLDNLRHYRNLITFLVNKQKQRTMDAKLLKELALADDKKTLPKWSQVTGVIESATALQRCLESALRGKLLIGIRDCLKQRGVEAWFYSDAEPSGEQAIDSAFDERFEIEQNVCVRVNEDVIVCAGAYGDEPKEGVVWLGYLRSATSSKADKYAPIVLQEARRHLANLSKTNAPWYVWDWQKDITYDDLSAEGTAEQIADKLIQMRDGLGAALKSQRSK